MYNYIQNYLYTLNFVHLEFLDERIKYFGAGQCITGVFGAQLQFLFYFSNRWRLMVVKTQSFLEMPKSYSVFLSFYVGLGHV